MATFAQRIEELIGSDYTTIAANSQYELFNAAIAEVADMLPSELLLKYASTPIRLDDDPTSETGTDVSGKKVLLIRRLDSQGISRECRAVAVHEFFRSKDTTSIYYATDFSPVYAYIPSGGSTRLKIFPTTTNTEIADVYVFSYPNYSEAADLATNTITGLPDEVEQAVCLKAVINILQTYVSDFVQDEEDSEMLQMLTSQMQSLNTLFQSEMARYTESDKQPRGE